jgi:MFS family permease
VALVIIDTSTLDISPYIFGDEDFYNLIVFSILFVLGAISQYAILRIIGKKVRKLLSFINTIVPFSLFFILLVILLEIYITSSYHTILVRILTWIIYGTALINMSVLVFHFFLWFRINKNYMIISYTVAIISILINLTVSMIAVTQHTSIEPRIINWYYNPVAASSRVSTIMDSIYNLTSVTTFILIWLSSILLLLSHYAKKYGMIKFVIITIAPLIYFISLFLPSLTYFFAGLSLSYPLLARIIYTFLISAGKPIGGFLFGLIFWSASKNVDNKLLREYMVIAGYGIMILFTSNQLMSLVILDYPPFGLVTVTFFSLASYISFIGIYASAVCVAQDKELRRTLRKSSEKNIHLFNQIGKSEMEKKLMTTADILIKKLKDETGVQTVEEEDYKKYVEDAIREVKKEKKL